MPVRQGLPAVFLRLDSSNYTQKKNAVHIGKAMICLPHTVLFVNPHLPRQRCITFPDRRLGSRPVDGRGRGGEALFPAPVPATGTFFRYGIVLRFFYDTLNKLR